MQAPVNARKANPGPVSVIVFPRTDGQVTGKETADMNLIGIDIGGTKCAVTVGTKEKNEILVKEKSVFATSEETSPEGVLNRLEQESRRLAEKVGTVGGIGISCGGPLDSKRGLILSPPNLPGWDNIPITEYFSSRFHVPVFLQNDANACALAECRYGAGKGLDNMVFLTFGTGIGAGLILNGKLYEGKQSIAGEAGHWRMASFGPIGYGKAGSFEGFCSGGGIAQLARQKILEQLQMGKTHPLAEKLENISAKDVSRFAWGGDQLCIDVCKIVGEYFGRGLAMLIDLLNPQAIITGGIFTRDYRMFLPMVEKVICQEALSVPAQACKILPSELGEKVGDIAALTVAQGM